MSDTKLIVESDSQEVKDLQPKKPELKPSEVTSEKSLERARGSSLAYHAFNLERKAKFIEVASKLFPNITQICRVVGIDPSTYYLHLKKDPEFSARMAGVSEEITDRVEGVMATEAVNPKSFLDRMAYLRAHRPELYDRAKVVRIEGYKMADGERGKRIGAIEGAIDATIVSAYQTRKERQQAKRLKSGEEQQGKDRGAEDGGQP